MFQDYYILILLYEKDTRLLPTVELGLHAVTVAPHANIANIVITNSLELTAQMATISPFDMPFADRALAIITIWCFTSSNVSLSPPLAFAYRE